MGANSLVCVKSPVLELELGSVEAGTAFRVSVCVCFCGQPAGSVLCVRLSNSRGAHVEKRGPEESPRGLTGQWTVVGSIPLERNVAEHMRERERERNPATECRI